MSHTSIYHFIKRAMAYMIDCIICYSFVMLVIQWGILSQFREQWGITDEWFQNSLNLEIYVLSTISLPVWIYFTVLDSRKGKGTVGKRWLKFAVVKKNDEKRISMGSSFLRTGLKLMPWEISHLGIVFPVPMYFQEEPVIRTLTIIGIVLFLVYMLSVILDKESQIIYDKLLNTIVVDKSNT